MGGKYLAKNRSADYIRSGQKPPRKKRRNSGFPVLCILLLTLIIVLAFCLRSLLTEDPEKNPGIPGGTEGEVQTDAPPTEPFEPVTATASIAVTGDVLMHMPVVNSCKVDGGYDFTGIFQYLDDYASGADYAIANLETTLAGTGNGYAYSGYPCFNCPDDIATALKGAGFDMLLTANNHCYDTRTVGLTRTLEVAKETGLDTLGTQSSAADTDWVIQDINGIQIGMMCYSYATADSYPDRPSMNGILTGTDAAGMVNYFDYDNLSAFYTEVESTLSAMEEAGAKATVMYIHWGEEYQLSANANQTAIAQKLCDLGIDVIVGGHPHVVQPVDLLTSTEGGHKTVCLYSMGNAISNQQRQNMNLNTGHTEDGVLFQFSFTEYADGEVLLDTVDILPTWVYMDTTGSTRTYRILPLDDSVTDWATAFGVSQSVADSAKQSYDRTMKLVGIGLEESLEYLDAQREAKLADLTAPKT